MTGHDYITLVHKDGMRIQACLCARVMLLTHAHEDAIWRHPVGLPSPALRASSDGKACFVVRGVGAGMGRLELEAHRGWHKLGPIVL